jgi:D-alanyl-D-alanine carboxypeptidase
MVRGSGRSLLDVKSLSGVARDRQQQHLFLLVLMNSPTNSSRMPAAL